MKKDIAFYFRIGKPGSGTRTSIFTKKSDIDTLPIGSTFKPGGDFALRGTVNGYIYDEKEDCLTMQINAEHTVDIKDAENVKNKMNNFGYSSLVDPR